MLEYSNFEEVSCASFLNNRNGANLKLHIYAVDGLMIDCGPEILSEEIKDFARRNNIKQAVISHMHEDHCGMAHWFSNELGVPVYLHEASIDEASRDGVYASYRQLTWGNRPAFKAQKMPELVVTPSFSFQVIFTPGHTSEHYVFFEESRGWLFTGDLFVRAKSRFSYAEEDLSLQIKTLEEVLKLPIKTVFCAHAGILINGRERLTEKLDFLRDMQDTVRGYRERGLSNKEIEKLLFPEEHFITAISEGEWSAYHMIETL